MTKRQALRNLYHSQTQPFVAYRENAGRTIVPDRFVRCTQGVCATMLGRPAVALAPQVTSSKDQSFTFIGETYRYVPVCEDHLDGWWDGSDDKPISDRPPFVAFHQGNDA